MCLCGNSNTRVGEWTCLAVLLRHTHTSDTRTRRNLFLPLSHVRSQALQQQFQQATISLQNSTAALATAQAHIGELQEELDREVNVWLLRQGRGIVRLSGTERRQLSKSMTASAAVKHCVLWAAACVTSGLSAAQLCVRSVPLATDMPMHALKLCCFALNYLFAPILCVCGPPLPPDCACRTRRTASWARRTAR